MRSNRSAEARVAVSDAPLPYEPSVPCARCARGVDPLRAPCVSATEARIHYFCSRACRSAFTAAEVVHAERTVAPTPARRPTKSGPIPRTRSFEPISRRIEEAPVRLVSWPPAVSAACAIASFFPVGTVQPLLVLLTIASAGLLAHQAAHTRAAIGRIGALVAPAAMALLGVSALLSPRPEPLVAAALGVIGCWLSERRLAQAAARLTAERAQLEARLPLHVVVRAPGHGPELVERPAALLREGDEIRIEAPAVAAVDGVVIAGAGELVPYPGADAPIPRAAGSTVLAGALLTEGALTVRATRVGSACALRHALSTPTRHGLPPPLARTLEAHPRAIGGTIAGLVALVAATADTLPAALSALGAGWLALPLLLLARGPRSVVQATGIATAARGVHVRARGSLDVAGRVDTAVVRVEGVLLEPACSVDAVSSLSPSYDPAELVALAHAAGAADEAHPVSRAIAIHSAAHAIKPALLRRLTRTEGRGITALTDGDGELVLGSRAALLAAGVSVAVADRQALDAERAGRRVVFLAVGGRVRGFFQLRLTVRQGAHEAMQALCALGVDVVLLASDHQATADAIAHVLGVPPGKTELTALQRADAVRHLCESDARVLAMGRLPHDEALLDAADASLCIDGAGHAHGGALATASPDLREGVLALALARRARHLVQACCGLGACSLVAAFLGAARVVPASVVAGLSLVVAWLALAWAPAHARAPMRRAEIAKSK